MESNQQGTKANDDFLLICYFVCRYYLCYCIFLIPYCFLRFSLYTLIRIYHDNHTLLYIIQTQTNQNNKNPNDSNEPMNAQQAISTFNIISTASL